ISASMHALKKKSVANGGGEALPIALAYWPKPKRCYSTTAPNSSPSLGDYCRRERHESASARFDTNRHPRNGPESCSYSCARTGAAADQSAGKGARKSIAPTHSVWRSLRPELFPRRRFRAGEVACWLRKEPPQ